MTNDASEASPDVLRGRTNDARIAGSLSQWQLIRIRFRRHRLAVWSLYMIVILYSIAAFAEILSPYSKSRRNVYYSYAPPQIPRFSIRDGFYVYDQIQHTDKETLARYYELSREVRVPLGFFVKGGHYRIWGLIRGERHFFGLDEAAFVKAFPSKRIPDFHFFGADQFGRDIVSRIIFGARISLSIGLVSIFFTFICFNCQLFSSLYIFKSFFKI